jgi:hypothetical protein
MYRPWDPVNVGSVGHKAATYTQDNINAGYFRYQCLEWDSKPRHQLFELAIAVYAVYRTVTVVGVVMQLVS